MSLLGQKTWMRLWFYGYSRRCRRLCSCLWGTKANLACALKTIPLMLRMFFDEEGNRALHEFLGHVNAECLYSNSACYKRKLVAELTIRPSLTSRFSTVRAPMAPVGVSWSARSLSGREFSAVIDWVHLQPSIQISFFSPRRQGLRVLFLLPIE